MFNSAFENFKAGNWSRAKMQFNQVEAIKKDKDTPSQLLLDFMAKTNYEPPADWKGFRH